MIFWISYALAILPFKILFPTKIIDRINLNKGKCIICCNHMSNLDIIIIGLFLKRKFKVLAKKELFNKKFIGWYLKKLGAISIDRQNVGLSSIKESVKALNDGKTLVIFPTGTRTETAEEVQNLKLGVAKFAIMGKADIIPCILTSKPKIFKRNKFVVGSTIKIDEYLERKNDKTIYNEISQRISDSMMEMLNKNSV